MSWKSVKLGALIELQNGYAFKSSEYADDGFFLMRITNVQQGYIQSNNPKYVSIANDSKLKQFILNEGDILISLTGDVGRVGIIKSNHLPAALNQRVARVTIKSKNDLNKDYLFHLLNSEFIRKKIESLGHGAAQLNVSTKDILTIEIPLPPIAIQNNIVTKLDKIFVEIDKATESAKANAKNSYGLYSSAVDSFFENLDNESVKLSVCAEIGYGYTSKSSIDFDGPQYLRITDIQDDNVDWLLVPRIEDAEIEIKKYLLKDGDIVFARTGATTGKSFLVVDPPLSVFASYLIRVDADRSLVLPEYLRHFFRSESYWNTINAGISGAAQGGFNASKLGELSFPLPDLNKQRKIVEELSTIEMLAISSKKSFEMKVNLLELLKNSILKKAFNGELVKE